MDETIKRMLILCFELSRDVTLLSENRRRRMPCSLFYVKSKLLCLNKINYFLLFKYYFIMNYQNRTLRYAAIIFSVFVVFIYIILNDKTFVFKINVIVNKLATLMREQIILWRINFLPDCK